MPTSRAIPTKVDVLGYFETLSNEGRWGPTTNAER